MTVPLSPRAWALTGAIAVVAIVAVVLVVPLTGRSAAPSASGARARLLASFPGPANTGVPIGTVLRRVPQDLTSGPGWHADAVGNVRVDTPGATLDRLLIRGAVVSAQPGLTLRDTRVQCIGENDWCVTLESHSTVTDSEIGGGADGHTFGHAIGLYSGGSGSGNVISRVNVHHTIHGMRIDGGTLVQDSWIHDMPMGDPVVNLATRATKTDDHTDAVMSTSGSGTILRHNRIESGNTATVFVQWDGSERIGSYLVENNLFLDVRRNGQVSSWGVAIEDKGIAGPVVVRGNTFNGDWQVASVMAPPGAVVTRNTQTALLPTH